MTMSAWSSTPLLRKRCWQAQTRTTHNFGPKSLPLGSGICYGSLTNAHRRWTTPCKPGKKHATRIKDKDTRLASKTSSLTHRVRSPPKRVQANTIQNALPCPHQSRQPLNVCSDFRDMSWNISYHLPLLEEYPADHPQASTTPWWFMHSILTFLAPLGMGISFCLRTRAATRALR